MNGIRLEDMSEGKVRVGDVTYGIDEIRTASEVVWPSQSITYVLSDVALVYSSGTQILADGSNYAYITATVTTKRGSTVIDVQTGVTLTLNKVSGDLSISGTHIVGEDRGTTEGSALSGVYSGVYNGVYTENQTVTQEANVKTTSISAVYTLVADDTSDVAAAGETRTLTATSVQVTTNTYTSGASTSSEIDVTCTTSCNVGTALESSVSGRNQRLNWRIPANTETGSRRCTYTITPRLGTGATAELTQLPA